MQNSGLLKYKVLHLFFWMFVFGLWYYLRYQDYSTEAIALQITLLKVAALVIAVYTTNYLLIPRLLYRKWYAGFVIAFIALILLCSVIKIVVMSKIMQQPEMLSLSGNVKSRFYENVISDFFLITTGAAFKLIFDYAGMQRRLVEIAKEKAETELNFLKSQINPHFLFNSLNSVYFLIDKNNAEARGALHKFSEMLRYQLYEVKDDKIPVEKEISYLKDYIDLQKLRTDESYAVNFNYSTDIKGFSIEPLLLIPFVENAFKHISHFKDQANFITLDLTRSNGAFHFAIENSKEERKFNDRNGGIGLTNVKRRLELLYPEKHSLIIKSEDDKYKVELNLELDK